MKYAIYDVVIKKETEDIKRVLAPEGLNPLIISTIAEYKRVGYVLDTMRTIDLVIVKNTNGEWVLNLVSPYEKTSVREFAGRKYQELTDQSIKHYERIDYTQESERLTDNSTESGVESSEVEETSEQTLIEDTEFNDEDTEFNIEDTDFNVDAYECELKEQAKGIISQIKEEDYDFSSELTDSQTNLQYEMNRFIDIVCEEQPGFELIEQGIDTILKSHNVPNNTRKGHLGQLRHRESFYRKYYNNKPYKLVQKGSLDKLTQPRAEVEETYLARSMNYYLECFGLDSLKHYKLRSDILKGQKPIHRLGTYGDILIKNFVQQRELFGHEYYYMQSNESMKLALIRLGLDEFAYADTHLAGTVFEVLVACAYTQDNTELFNQLMRELFGNIDRASNKHYEYFKTYFTTNE